MEQQPKQLTNQEKYEAKRQEKLIAQGLAARKQRFKKIAIWVLSGLLLLVLIGGGVWYIATRPSIPESDIVSRNGFHWHPELTIYVKGEKLEIPENIGIGAVHKPIHTHDDSDKGVVHMEFQGLVKNQDATLGQFFKNWGKDIRSFGQNMKMTVNGQENTEYENYLMKDKDKIELRYE
jgi:hypothetical protein